MSMSVERSSQQISIKNGRPLAGMNPGGMSMRDANATSMMLAMSVRVLRLPELKRISQGGIFLDANFTSKSETAGAAEAAAQTGTAYLNCGDATLKTLGNGYRLVCLKRGQVVASNPSGDNAILRPIPRKPGKIAGD